MKKTIFIVIILLMILSINVYSNSDKIISATVEEASITWVDYNLTEIPIRVGLDNQNNIIEKGSQFLVKVSDVKVEDDLFSDLDTPNLSNIFPTFLYGIEDSRGNAITKLKEKVGVYFQIPEDYDFDELEIAKTLIGSDIEETDIEIVIVEGAKYAKILTDSFSNLSGENNNQDNTKPGDDTGKNYEEGTSTAKIFNEKITWVKEQADGEKYWFGIDNSNGEFLENSVFWTRVIDKDANNNEFEKYYNFLDKKINTEKSLIFEVGITNTNGEEYTKLNQSVKLLIEHPDDWENEIEALYIDENNDEDIYTKKVQLDYPDGKKTFTELTLNHFSPYVIYEKSYVVTLDSNGGKFDGENNKILVEGWNIKSNEDIQKLEKPTKEGYKFLGYYTEITNGTSLEKYVAEAGIDGDLTFYAQWEKIETDNVEDNITENNPYENEEELSNDNNSDSNNNTNNNTITNITNNEESKSNKTSGNNPQTGDNIMTFVILFGISLIGIIITTIVKKFIKE